MSYVLIRNHSPFAEPFPPEQRSFSLQCTKHCCEKAPRSNEKFLAEWL